MWQPRASRAVRRRLRFRPLTGSSSRIGRSKGHARGVRFVSGGPALPQIPSAVRTVLSRQYVFCFRWRSYASSPGGPPSIHDCIFGRVGLSSVQGRSWDFPANVTLIGPTLSYYRTMSPTSIHPLGSVPSVNRFVGRV
ncbi:hypothetical protein V2G26_006262 [Clonostachys chloroleuca]